jgi:FAD/FMN-containing dehydrogenase
MNKSGALQWENWEAWPEQNQQCYVESPRSVPCGQGRVSLYSAEVESAAHIQAAVNFAVTYNIKLAIKNSGHDFLGRSSAPDSLQISTYKMKNITVVDNFVPSVPSGTTAPVGIKAVTLGAGVQQHDLYTFLATQGVMVVGGSSNTVGIAGGYIQGGGHSLMGFIAGMASDNALEFKLVAANVRSDPSVYAGSLTQDSWIHREIL